MLTTPLMPAATELLMQGKQRFDERYLASLMSQAQQSGGGLPGGGSTPNDPRIDYLAQLGDMIMRLQQPQRTNGGGGMGGSLSLGSANLTGGFDADWLGKRISAGSAEGATIGGGGGGGGKREDPLDDPHNPGRSAVTAREYSKMKGADRLTGGGGGMWNSMKGWFGGGK